MTRFLMALQLMPGLTSGGNVNVDRCRSSMGKLGVELGQATLFFRRQTGAGQ
uniref:hypothetical protein n=1 Tax=Pseudomonas sp. G2-4 TaxID=1506334 RepID=UPI0024B94E57|nr:hypothetical protein [Pseudomonas sp. G2-4]WHS62841.1 hypothetical protein QNH97_12630 [Pseudomonas sp. G2-4]